MAMGNKYGAHRVIELKGLLPQAAKDRQQDGDLYNEILIDVSALNIDSASFRQPDRVEQNENPKRWF